MTRMAEGLRRPLLLLLACCTVAGCIHRFSALRQEEIALGGPASIASPVKAHLKDGSVVIYPTGATVGRDSIHGSGMWYDALRRDSTAHAAALAMDRVVGLESFSLRTNTAQSALVSLAASAGIAVVAVAGIVAIACIADPKCFGSCPTVYTMAESGEVLEAELFSYSVAPLLEARDVDLLGARVDAQGYVDLEIRNEALETHQINHLELLEVRHAAGESVLPDERGRPLVVDGYAAARARDRTGRDVSAELAMRDSMSFATQRQVLASASLDDMHDHIDIAVPRPSGRDSVAVVLRMRNSLLNTVLFYDMMLGSAGAKALDWLGTDLQRIGPAVELGSWYASRFGMWVAVEDGGAYRAVTRVADTGPIAWTDMAVLVPVPATGDSMRIRLSFVMDEWRIDQVRVALDARRAEPRSIRLMDVIGADEMSIPDALLRMAEPDELYVETGPGHRFTARFHAGADRGDGTRTFLLSSQGFYTEWIRPDWVRFAQQPEPFRPGDPTLLAALRRWDEVKPEFERRFYETRIPVR